MWIFVVGGSMLVPLVFAVQQWSRRKRQLQVLEGHSCPICKNSFDDTIVTHMGGIGYRARQQLDNFQARYARFLVRCEDCGTVLVCTDDGAVIKHLKEY
ncbi:MAG: hypothetical protein ACOCXA_07275 [Planctomycetota bacterium]